MRQWIDETSRNGPGRHWLFNLFDFNEFPSRWCGRLAPVAGAGPFAAHVLEHA
jgi:hypothetical protein